MIIQSYPEGGEWEATSLKAGFFTVRFLTSSTLEVIRNADSQAPSRPTELEILEVEPSNLCFNIPWWFGCTPRSENHCCKDHNVRLWFLMWRCYTECVSPEFICWNLIPGMMVFGGGAFGRWLGQEGGTFINGISALVKETPETSPVLSTMWGYSDKTAIHEHRSRFSPDTKSTSALILDIPASRTVEVYGTVIAAHTD